MRLSTAFFPLAAAAILITGCGSEKPAKDAVAQATASVETLRPEATQYAPEQMKAVDATLASMNDNLAKEKYAEVIKQIPQINNDYKAAQEAVVSMQTLTAAAQNEWQLLNTEVPQTVQELEMRVVNLSSGERPKGVTNATIAEAKTEIQEMKTTWAEATAAASAGDTFEATNKGRSVQMKGEKLKEQLDPNATVAKL